MVESLELVQARNGYPGAPAVKVRPRKGLDPVILSQQEARALLRALAAHLGVELPPEGWRATEYVRPAGDMPALYLRGGFGVWSGTVDLYGDRPRSIKDWKASAIEAAAAVEALASLTTTEPASGEER